MATWGLEFVQSIRDGRSPFPPPPWAVKTNAVGKFILETVENGRVRHRWTAQEEFAMQDGVLQGGFLLVVADASQSLCLISTHAEFEIWVTSDFQIRYIRPVRVGAPVSIESVVVSKTTTKAVLETTLTLEGGKLAARVSGGWTKLDSGRRGFAGSQGAEAH